LVEFKFHVKGKGGLETGNYEAGRRYPLDSPSLDYPGPAGEHFARL
jgi:hypothetical protein